MSTSFSQCWLRLVHALCMLSVSVSSHGHQSYYVLKTLFTGVSIPLALRIFLLPLLHSFLNPGIFVKNQMSIDV